MTKIALSQITGAQALRSTVRLEPVDGPGGRIFPPTFPGEGAGAPARHVVETLKDGSKRVLIDSVASQANRQEHALVSARQDGRIKFSDVYIDLGDTDAGIAMLSATEMPHRLSDAILRDSMIDGVGFNNSELGKSILSTTSTNLSALLEVSPTTVLYGCWFSGFGVATPLKLQRNVVADIWAEGVDLGQSVGGRIDPLGIEKVELYQALKGGWTAVEAEATRDGNGKPKRFGKDPSEIKHGNIPPTIITRGVTAEKIVLRWALPLAAVRRLRFGGEPRDLAGRGYIAALAIAARALQHEAGYSLRSRCDLISAGPLSFEIIDRDGAIETKVIDTPLALNLLHEAEEGMRRAGLAVDKRTDVKPSDKLKGLIAANRRHQLASDEAAA